jgi:putative alpha-1,2-mannosidase
VPGGAFTIETAGFVEPERDGPVQYVQSVRLDDQPLERSWITLAELHRGGRLHIELGHEPSAWGTTLRPPSVSVATAGVPSTTGARLRERSHP